MHIRHVHVAIYSTSMTFCDSTKNSASVCPVTYVWGSLMEAGDKPRRLSIRTIVAMDGEMGIGYRGGMPWPFMK